MKNNENTCPSPSPRPPGRLSSAYQLGDLVLYARDLCPGDCGRPGWSSPQLYLGLTLAMLVMAMVSPFVARLLAYAGGQNVVMSGTLLIAASCAGMAYTQTLFGWYGAWLVAGIGMRLSLYDALFAALVNLYGQQARRTISRITLAGGLASAVFWPLGDGLLKVMSWQHALQIYALFGLLSAVLIRTLPHQQLAAPARYRAARARGTA